MSQGRVFLCSQSGRVMVDPGDGSLPRALHDYCRDRYYAERARLQEEASAYTPRPSIVDPYFEAASAAASCSRVF